MHSLTQRKNVGGCSMSFSCSPYASTNAFKNGLKLLKIEFHFSNKGTNYDKACYVSKV